MSFRFIPYAFGLAVLSLPSASATEYVVTELLSDRTIRVHHVTGDALSDLRDAVAVIESQSTGEPLGYALLNSRIPTADGSVDWIATVMAHGKASLVRPGARVRTVDLTRKVPELPARFDLIQLRQRKVANRYKPQVYLGHYAGGSTAATLYNSERLVGPFIAAYGLNDFWQIDTTPATLIVGEPSVGLKWNGYDDQENRISLQARYNYSIRARESYGSLSILWDSSGASRFIGYTQLKILTRQPSEVVATGEVSDRRFTAELQTFQGFLTSGWNRIVAGPRLNLENKTIGGTLAYYHMGNIFDWMVGLRAENFVNDDLSAKGYLPFAEFWWRF